MKLTPAQLRGLTGSLVETREVELSCEDYLDVVAPYAELRAAGRPIPASLDDVVAHERLCASCREETAALVALLAAPAPGH